VAAVRARICVKPEGLDPKGLWTEIGCLPGFQRNPSLVTETITPDGAAAAPPATNLANAIVRVTAVRYTANDRVAGPSKMDILGKLGQQRLLGAG
jgi:hypothetical protein